MTGPDRINGETDLSAGRVLELKNMASGLVKKNDDLTILFLKIGGNQTFSIIGSFYGRNMQTLPFGEVTDLKKMKKFIPDENSISDLLKAVNITIQTGKRTKVKYMRAIDNNTLEERTAIFLKHDMEHVIVHIHRKAENKIIVKLI